MESERQTYQVHNILTWRSDAALIGEILRCGLKCTTPRLVYASLVASERKLRMTAGTPLKSTHRQSSLQTSNKEL